jgi:hypothetical protein
MYVARVPNRGSPPAVLLRESYREGGKVRNRTLANLSRWPEEKVDALARLLKGLPPRSVTSVSSPVVEDTDVVINSIVRSSSSEQLSLPPDRAAQDAVAEPSVTIDQRNDACPTSHPSHGRIDRRVVLSQRATRR